MTVKLGMRVFWNHGPMPVSTRKTARLVMNVPFGTVMNLGGNGGSGGAVDSVNGQTGAVMLDAVDVGADVAGAAQAVSNVLQPQITLNTDAVAMLTALLSALQSAKADVSYVNQQIATLVGTDTQTLAAINAISDALSDNEDLLSALDQTVANRVRFDVSTQGLTALQKYNARTNIGAEESGTAAQLISQITATSIGAVTASQLANVAFSGSYNDLSNKPSITGALLTGLTSVSAAAISATDSIIGALAKLQANVDTKADATNTLALINSKVSSVLLGVANGVATLGSDGKLTAAQAPTGGGITITDVRTELNTFVKKNPYSYYESVAPIITGDSALALGYSSVAKGEGATSFGYSAQGEAAGAVCVGFSAQVLSASSTGSIAIGRESRASGSYEIALGYQATTVLGNGIAMGISASARNKSTAIGGFSQALYVNSTSLGYQAQCTADNQVQLGNSATTTYAYGAVQNRSDIRDKTNLSECDLGLDFINQLQPKKWQWDYRDDYAQTLFPVLIRTDFTDDEAYQSALTQQDADRAAFYANPVKDGSKARHRYHYGLIAQELKATLDALGIDYAAYQDHSLEGGLDVKSIGYDELIAPLIKAVQELSARISVLESEPNI